MANEEKATNNTHVPDKLHGYTLQVRHMMYELISLDLDATVSLEALDDVAVESRDGVIAEQIKSVQSNNNPLADRASVFWKCLYNWFQSINNGELSIDTTVFKFIVISDRNTTVGSIAQMFSDADTDDTAKKAIGNAKETLWGEKDELRSSIPDGYKAYLETLFNHTGSIFKEIVKKMHIEIHAANYDEKLFKKFCSLTIPKEYEDILFIYMRGWVDEQVNIKTKASCAAYISVRSFRDELVAQIRRYNQKDVLAWITTAPSNEEAQKEVEKEDVYIKQLGFIDIENGEKISAANDFLRTSVEKTVWADIGIVVPQSFDDYNDSLFRMWNNQSNIISLSYKNISNTEQGKMLYYNCKDKVTNVKVQGSDPPSFFGIGSLHSLANEPSNNPKIGWHPKYKEMLTANGGKNE